MSRKEKVSVDLRVRLDGKQPSHPAVWESKKRLKDHICLVGDAEEHRPDGVYYLRYRVNGKQVWESVEGSATSSSIFGRSTSSRSRTRTPAPAADSPNSTRTRSVFSQRESRTVQTPDVYALLKEPKRLFASEEVRAILHLSESTLRRWVANNKLKFFRLGRQLRFDSATIAGALRDREG
jgi:excisionase family DNA binding protein